MRVTALDGREIQVRRLWMPWRVRTRDLPTDGSSLDFLDFSDGIEGLVFGLILVVVFALFGTFIFFGFELVLVVLLLVPLLALLRMFWVLPWRIEVRSGGDVLGVEKIRGWNDSENRIRDLAAAYQRGENLL